MMSQVTIGDGFDTTLVLDCGCTMRSNSEAEKPLVGWYFSCHLHSPHEGYDPDDGLPLYDRNRKVIEVRSER